MRIDGCVGLGDTHSGEVVEEEGGRMESDLERIWWPRDSPVDNPSRFVRNAQICVNISHNGG